MSGRFFLDTNIFIYSIDERFPTKQARAGELITAALAGDGIISYQVVQEFLNAAQNKFQHVMSPQQALSYLDAILNPLCVVQSHPALYRSALATKMRWRFSWYEALIVAGAQAAHCTILYSEDLQHQQQLDQLTVINPFEQPA